MSFSKYSWPPTSRSSSSASPKSCSYDKNTSQSTGTTVSRDFESSSEDGVFGRVKDSSSYRSPSTDMRGPQTPDIPTYGRTSLAQLALVARLEAMRLQKFSGTNSALLASAYDAKCEKAPLSGYESADSQFSVSARAENTGRSTMGHLILVAEYERLRLKYVECNSFVKGFTMTLEEYLDMAAEEEGFTSDHEVEEDAQTSCSATVYGDEEDVCGYEGDAESEEERWVSSDSGDADVSDDDYEDFDGWKF